jgi:AcrR family transcriptional regulator
MGTKKLRQDDRRESILHRAAKVFAESGYNATKLEDILEAADISRTLFYVHFKSKKELYLAILEDDFISIPGDLSTAGRARQRIAEVLAAAQSEPDYFRLLFRHAAREPEFSGFMVRRDALGERFIENSLAASISDSDDRKFVSHMIRVAILSNVLAWVDYGCPHPEKMQSFLEQLVKTTVVSFMPKNEN